MKTKQALAISENPQAHSLEDRRIAWMVLTIGALRCFAQSPRQKEWIAAYQKIGLTIPK